MSDEEFENAIKIIKKYDIEDKLGLKKEINNLVTIIKNIKNQSDIKIAVVGLYNHGKSTLLNALSESLDKSNFKVSDKRETRENQELSCYIDKHKVTYIDTPGLNADDSDDNEAISALDKGDIMIFVHSINAGDLIADEVQYLENMAKCYGNSFVKNTIFVLTRADSCSDDDKQQALEVVKKQFSNIFKIEITPLIVSAENYIKGKNGDKKLLIQKSNIDSLKEKLNDMILHYGDGRMKRANQKKEEVNSKIDLIIENINKQKRSLIDTRDSLQSQIDEDLAKANKTLKNMREGD